MMLRLWEPILWRHLRVANHHVRSNAARFFLAAFPIENNREEIQIRAEKQVLCSTIFAKSLFFL
jgi:hypothetical protein